MHALKIFSQVEVLTGAALILASIALCLKVKDDIPDDLRKEWTYTLSLMVFCFASYIFLVLILSGNISYPIEEVASSMFLAIACSVYICIILIKMSIRKVMDKDRAIREHDDLMKEKAAELEREMAVRERVEDELKQKLEEVERLNKLMVGRELQLGGLREEIKRLNMRMGGIEDGRT